MNYEHNNKRLDDIARNILIGMELVDKRVDTLGGKKAKKELNEEETLEAIRVTNNFFLDKGNQRKLALLKNLIVDNKYRDAFRNLYHGVQVTPQSQINEMNVSVNYNPYNEKDE